MEVFDLLVLSCAPDIGPGRLLTLVSQFGDPRLVLDASPSDLAAAGGLPRTVASAVARFKHTPAYVAGRRYADRQLSSANRNDCALVTFWDPRYPDLLKRIADPPAILYVKGTLTADDRCSVAVVGTRKPTAYGVMAAQRFARELARTGIAVTSGLARGIDTVAHSVALQEGGRTLAVIGSGIDVVYPPENLPLARQIARRGCVVSECAMGVKPDAANFPRRNRLISGLTLGTIVIESDVDGGALITARSALDQNREVFAVPAPITAGHCHGTNLLIKEGSAKLVETIEDVFAELAGRFRSLGRPMPPSPSTTELTLFERAVYEALSESPDHLPRIARAAKMPVADVLENLERLVAGGLVRRFSGKRFARRT